MNFESNTKDMINVGRTITVGKSIQNSITAFQEVEWSSSTFSSGITNSLTYALFIPPVVPMAGISINI